MSEEQYASITRFLPDHGGLRAWVQASRLIGQLNLHLPIGLGEALAYSITGKFSLTLSLLIHGFGVVDGLFVSYSNDVADAEADARNTTFALFSGGSRVIAEGKLTKRALAIASFVMLGCMWAFASALAFAFARPLALGFAAVAVLLMHGYSFPPLRLSYRGGGEVLQGLGLGVVLPLFAYYGQTGELATFPWATLIPLFMLWHAANVASSLPDTPSDRECGKRTYPVRKGERRSRRDALVIISAAGLLALVTGPALPLVAKLLIVGPAALMVAMSARLVPTADATDRAACKRVVMLDVSAVNLVHGWWLASLVYTAGTRP